MQSGFSATLRVLREKKGVSRRCLADHVESSSSSISRYELGQQSPDLECAIRIANYFEVTMDQLCGRDPAWLKGFFGGEAQRRKAENCGAAVAWRD